MEFSIKSTTPDKQRSACVVVGVFEARKLSSAGAAIDRMSRGYVSEIMRGGDMQGRLGSTLLLHRVPHTPNERVLLVGCGREREFKDRQYRDAVAAAARAVRDTGAIEAVSFLPELSVKGRTLAWNIEQAVSVSAAALYRFDHLKSGNQTPQSKLKKIVLNLARRSDLEKAEVALRQGVAISHGVAVARDLGNLPPNVCTPTYLAEQAQALGKAYGFKVEVLEQKDMERLKMGALLSVSRGSRQPPKFIVMHYQGAAKQKKPIVLVGKGITFDSGGISIKPAADMDEMKFDMCGAASVLGTFKALGEMRLKLNALGIIPSCENLPDGSASKPGDVVTSMSGQTIEILNTDAEGRLILCDALTYAQRFEPAAVIDIATLTGACVIALGNVASGLFSNRDPLARELLGASDYAGDPAWQLPLWDDYQNQLKSNFADMANIGGRPAGSITAACFLSRFTKEYDWAHLDIAGTAWKSGKEKGATGRPVPLLTRFLIGRAAQ
ncbi:MAG: leucyl aminopeptidase [Burkholderiales bacterium]